MKLSNVLPFITYAISTYVLIAPAFTVNQFNLSPWLSFLIVSIPFGGRIIGSIIYQRVIVLGTRTVFASAMISLGVLSVLSSIDDVYTIIPLRFLVGVAFGIATSLAVEKATRSGNRLIVALSMSGWAVGWIMGAISYLALKYWSLIALSGIITVPFSIQKMESEPLIVVKQSLPTLSSVLIFLFSFEPAFVLQLAPYVVDSYGGIYWLIIGYIISIPMYLIVPTLSSSLGELKTVIIYTSTSATTGVLFFLTSSPYLLIPFTAFGLGINSLAPRLALAYGANARNMGIALNLAALGGVIIPVVSTINIRIVASLITVISMALLLVMKVRKGEGIVVQ